MKEAIKEAIIQIRTTIVSYIIILLILSVKPYTGHADSQGYIM